MPIQDVLEIFIPNKNLVQIVREYGIYMVAYENNFLVRNYMVCFRYIKIIDKNGYLKKNLHYYDDEEDYNFQLKSIINKNSSELCHIINYSYPKKIMDYFTTKYTYDDAKYHCISYNNVQYQLIIPMALHIFLKDIHFTCDLDIFRNYQIIGHASYRFIMINSSPLHSNYGNIILIICINGSLHVEKNIDAIEFLKLLT